MNTSTNYTLILDVGRGRIIVRRVAANVGVAAFQAAERLGFEFVDGRTYLHIPVSFDGQPISSDAHTVWKYVAPVVPASSARRVEG